MPSLKPSPENMAPAVLEPSPENLAPAVLPATGDWLHPSRGVLEVPGVPTASGRERREGER